MMMSAEAIDLNDVRWRAFATELNKSLGVYPNEFRHDGNRAGVLIVWKAQTSEDFPMNKLGVDYLVKAQREGRIEGHVVLARRRQEGKIETVSVKGIEDVACMVSGVPPKVGRFGPYWWLHADFMLDGFGALDQAPF
jgi:hypothetical protein